MLISVKKLYTHYNKKNMSFNSAKLSTIYSGLNLKLGRIKGNTLIYGGGIATLKKVEVTENGFELGAGLTINELEEKLKEIEPRVERRYLVHSFSLVLLWY